MTILSNISLPKYNITVQFTQYTVELDYIGILNLTTLACTIIFFTYSEGCPITNGKNIPYTKLNFELAKFTCNIIKLVHKSQSIL